MIGPYALAVITGPGRGIGRSIAIAFARRGLHVALLGRNFPDLQAVAAEIGETAMPFRCDVSDAADVASCAASIATPTVLVNNAGIVHRASVDETTEEDWDRVLDVNLKGTFLVTRAFLPGMKRAGRGRIVQIASISGTLGTPRLSAYCASKWGMIGFTKSLAEELRGTGVQTMAVSPGSVDTEMLQGSGFGPQMTADEIANVVAYAALDAPDALHGASIDVFGDRNP